MSDWLSCTEYGYGVQHVDKDPLAALASAADDMRPRNDPLVAAYGVYTKRFLRAEKRELELS